MRQILRRFFLGLGLMICGVILLVVILAVPRDDLASVNLADGRSLQIEGVTFGTNHVVGTRSPIVDRFGPWLPGKLAQTLTPKRPQTRINLARPALVVWVNALDPVTGKQVDCQQLQVEFVDEHGDIFGSENSHWFGGNSFWRVGHVFDAFPRGQRNLTFRIKPWRTNQLAQVTIPNPAFTKPALWTGLPPPQQQRIDDYAIRLNRLVATTNGGPQRYWEAMSRFWEPVWELNYQGRPAIGWDPPEWSAEDPTGNHAKNLGMHQPVLRFTVMFNPKATNLASTILLTNCPTVNTAGLQSNVWWNMPCVRPDLNLTILGILPPGTHHFTEGTYQPNPPPALRMSAVRGGAPSGWMGRSERVSPVRINHWHGHYTPSPTLYIRAGSLSSEQRLAVRLRGDTGSLWIARPETQGTPDGLHAFLVDLPAEVQSITAEIVLLKPVRCSFDVDTTTARDD